jgi:apolipoprotein N-acyltransferase
MPENRATIRRRAVDLVPASLATVIMLAVAMPGRLGWWPFLFFALVPLLEFTSRNNGVRSAVAGLLAGFLYHVCLLYWIVIVLGRYGGLPPWLSVPALLLLALYMGAYMGVFAGLLSFFRERCRKDRETVALFMAPFLWVGLDWLRGILFSGFPWMDLGYGLASVPLLIQGADLGGHHLITFCLVLVNVLLVFRPDTGADAAESVAERYAAAVGVISLIAGRRVFPGTVCADGKCAGRCGRGPGRDRAGQHCPG